MQISCNSDFAGSSGEFTSRLHEIAEAGFTHIMWCHQWCTDFLYTAPEIAKIKADLKECGLQLLDIHGSAAPEKNWRATVEYQRLAGVELVRNRLEMLSELEGSGVVMMHPPVMRYAGPLQDKKETMASFEAVLKSLDTLLPIAEKLGTKIALENLGFDDWTLQEEMLRRYPAKLLGICYDSGHGNIFRNMMHKIDEHKDRLIAMHLNDNDGTGDQHRPPFMGTVDWEKLTSIIRSSSYRNPLSFEITMCNTPFYNGTLQPCQTPELRKKFLADAYERCRKVAEMAEKGK